MHGELALHLGRIDVHPIGNDHVAPAVAQVGRVEVGVVVGHHPVRPFEELQAVLPRHAEQFRDRLQRQLAGDVAHELARLVLPRAGDDVLRPLGERALECEVQELDEDGRGSLVRMKVDAKGSAR